MSDFMQISEQNYDAVLVARVNDNDNDQERVDMQEKYNDRIAALTAALEYAMVRWFFFWVFGDFESIFQSGHKFMTQLKDVIPKIIKLFQSKSPTDVIEAIKFAVECKNFQLTNAEKGIRAMLDLIWSKV